MQALVEGWTERIRTQLLADGTAFDLTGYGTPPAKVELVLLCGNTVQAPQGSSGIDTPSTGIVYFDPAPGDLLAAQSPYLVRWRVTDSGGKVAYFPNGAPEQWLVSPA